MLTTHKSGVRKQKTYTTIFHTVSSLVQIHLYLAAFKSAFDKYKEQSKKKSSMTTFFEDWKWNVTWCLLDCFVIAALNINWCFKCFMRKSLIFFFLEKLILIFVWISSIENLCVGIQHYYISITNCLPASIYCCTRFFIHRVL